MNKLDFGFGNPWVLNEIFKSKYIPSLTFFSKCTTLPYAPNGGLPSLKEIVKTFIKDNLSNANYDHIIITNGATNAINTCLRYVAQEEKEQDIITLDFGYPFYTDMVKKAGLGKIEIDHTKDSMVINGIINSQKANWVLLDSPHNPSGKTYGFNSPKKIIWDATYHTKTYLSSKTFRYKPHNSEIIVGSFGKMLGITGIRIGFIATKNEELHNKLLHDNLMENATPSHLSQLMLLDVFSQVNVEDIILEGKRALDRNRHELAKLEYLTGQSVNEDGMFYFFEADEKLEKIFINSNIIYTRFVKDGKVYIRLNACQTLENVKEMVKRILNYDNKG